MKRLIGFLLSALCVIALASCSKGKIGDISVNSYRITEIKPLTLRYIECTVSLDITNNGPGLAFPRFEGEAFHQEQKVGDFVLLEPLVIQGNATASTNLKVKIVVSPEIPIFTLIGMFRNLDVSQYYISFDTVVQIDKLKVPVKRERLPLSRLVKHDEAME